MWHYQGQVFWYVGPILAQPGSEGFSDYLRDAPDDDCVAGVLYRDTHRRRTGCFTSGQPILPTMALS